MHKLDFHPASSQYNVIISEILFDTYVILEDHELVPKNRFFYDSLNEFHSNEG